MYLKKNAYKKKTRFLNDDNEGKLTPSVMYTHVPYIDLLTATNRVGNC